jgi:hypothetical protein
MTTDRIPTGYPRLDALLGGGLRADTLTGVLYEDNEACRDAANKLYNALGKRSGGMLDWYSTQGAPDPSVVKRDIEAELAAWVESRSRGGEHAG